MTMEEFWSSWLVIWLLAAPILLGVVGLAYSLYLSRHQLGAIKEALKNSRYVYVWGTCLGKRGLIFSLLEIAKIAQMITMPKSSLYIGELDAGDLVNFPPYLKRHLIINMTIIITAAIWMIVITVVLEFE